MEPLPPPPVLYRAPGLLVVDKPAGLAVTTPRRGGPSVERLLARQLGPRHRPRAVHRLDRDTSGCLAVALRAAELRWLAAAFAAGAVGKLYLAIVAPGPDEETGEVAAPLAKRSSRAAGWRMAVDPQGRPAVTRWRVLARRGESALLLLQPQTGRTHQLRVHAQALAPGGAIVGDPIYGRGEPGGLLLHAAVLELPGPRARAVVTSPLPGRFPAWARDAAARHLGAAEGSSEAIIASAMRPGSIG